MALRISNIARAKRNWTTVLVGPFGRLFRFPAELRYVCGRILLLTATGLLSRSAWCCPFPRWCPSVSMS